MSQQKQKHWTISSVLSCGHIQQDQLYAVTLTVTMMIFTQPAVDQAFCPPQTLIPGQHFVKDTPARLCYISDSLQ